jgi:integrase/recombinase XerD
MKQKVFASKLASYMMSFLIFKRALGLLYDTGEFYLHDFDRYCSDHEAENISLNIIVKNWTTLRVSECSNSQHVRVSPIREFGIYLQNMGYSDAFVLPRKICQKQIRTIPHFFTNDEISRFFGACDTLSPCKENIVRPFVLPVFFRLLYCCGFRTCEARLLLRSNVNITMGHIDILSSKGPRDRRIFLPEDLISLFDVYDTMLNGILPDRKYFFPIKTETGYTCWAVSDNFKKIWKSAGLDNISGSKPRAYDFRHHFAFANLNRWIEEGIDVNSMLPYLMRCMGHSNFESTFYYLHLVPEFFTVFSDKTKSLEGLLPEVQYDKEE